MKRLEKVIMHLLETEPQKLARILSKTDITFDLDGNLTECSKCPGCRRCRFAVDYGRCTENIFDCLMEEIDDSERDNN